MKARVPIVGARLARALAFEKQKAFVTISRAGTRAHARCAPTCAFLVALCFLFSSCSRTKIAATAAAAPPDTVAVPATAGRISNPKIDEASGLAASHRADGVLWTHNDSGGDAVLHAITADGKFLGSAALAGADNIDWEDMASFELGGRAYLLVADLGDNNGKRKSCSFYVIEEPDPAQLSPGRELVVPVAWNVPVLYPDAPHDCEAVAVDPGGAPDGSEGKVYLLTKRETPSRLFSVLLRPQSAMPPVAVGIGAQKKQPPQPPARDGEIFPPQTAWLVGKITAIPQPSATQKILPVPTGRFRACPTAMDFSPDGRFALILTYGDVLLYPRRDGESWFAALARDPVVLPPHKLGQAEAACFSRDGKFIFVTEENKNAPLLRYELR